MVRFAQLIALGFGLMLSPAFADEPNTFKIEFNDGKITPLEITVPAGQRITLELSNIGNTPAEFESRELSKEKVLAPKTQSTMILRTLDAGRYEFVDDFHPEAPPAIIIAK